MVDEIIEAPKAAPAPAPAVKPVARGHVRLKRVSKRGDSVMSNITAVTVVRDGHMRTIQIPNMQVVDVESDVAAKALATGAFDEHPDNFAKVKK